MRLLLLEDIAIFQFTTSQGGRRSLPIRYAYSAIFQFTTSQGGRLFFDSTIIAYFSFNSRPHKEVDRFVHYHIDVLASFNSRPHKEVDPYQPPTAESALDFQFTTSQGGRPKHGHREMG